MDKQQTQSWKEKLEQVRGYNKPKVEVELTEEQLQENEIEALLKEEFVEEAIQIHQMSIFTNEEKQSLRQ